MRLKKRSTIVARAVHGGKRLFTHPLLYKHLMPFYRRIVKNEFPLSVAIEVSSFCNLKCPHCFYQRNARKKGFMEKELFFRIVDECDGYEGVEVQLNGGGEPLMHKQFLEMARHACSKKNLGPLLFNTNGMLMKERIAEELTDFYRGTICFSLDGTEKIHEELRKGSRYDTVRKNIQYLLNAIERKNKKKDIRVVVICCNVSPPHDRESLNDFLIEWIELVDVVRFIEPFNNTAEIKNPENQLVDFDFHKFSGSLCNTPWTNIGITWDGHVTPCPVVFFNKIEKVPFGSIGELSRSSIKNIWQSEDVQTFRKCHLDNNLKGTLCEGCVLRSQVVEIPNEIIQDRQIVIQSTTISKNYSKQDN